MRIDVLASSSKGNCYRVNDGATPLLLECGIPFASMQRGLNFETAAVAGCLLTHEHGDHAKGLKDVLRAGIDCYLSRGTASALGLNGHRLHLINALKPFNVGTWRVLPFDTVHDAEEPLGFVLSSGSERLLFATDTAYVKYRFSGLTHVMIECNYDLAVLKANVEKGLVNREVKRRILRNHMSLSTAKDLLSANDLRQVRQIYLIHLSDDNSSASWFKREVQKLTGKEVIIA